MGAGVISDCSARCALAMQNLILTGSLQVPYLLLHIVSCFPAAFFHPVHTCRQSLLYFAYTTYEQVNSSNLCLPLASTSIFWAVSWDAASALILVLPSKLVSSAPSLDNYCQAFVNPKLHLTIVHVVKFLCRRVLR